MIFFVFLFFCILTENGKSTAGKKNVRESNVPVLTSHVGLNPRSKHASLSLSASFAALRAGNEREARGINHITTRKAGENNERQISRMAPKNSKSASKIR